MVIRKYVPGDEKSILKLFKLVFNQEMTEEFWYWRFKKNPFTGNIFIYLMWDGNKLVGHYAVSPVEMKLQGEIIKTALSMTTMTHPDYGGQGIFSKLAGELYKDLKEEFGYKMIWGFPNNNSHYGFIKNLDWKDIAIIPMMSVNLSQMRINRLDETLYAIEESFSLDVIAKLNSSSEPIKINKTKNYLEWRYFNNPTANYKVLNIENLPGIVVYKVIKSFDQSKDGYEIDILELFFDNDILVLSKLLNSIINNELKINIIKINLWKSIFSENRILLEKLGFKIGLPLTYLSYLNLDNLDLISDYKNWDVGLGYSDVF
jgi:GNAT superfamily N-acetyltransferase